MSIEKDWSRINEQQDDDLSRMLQQTALSKLSSQNPLKKIRTNMLINMIWGILICAFYIIIIFSFPIWQVQTIMAILLIFSLWALMKVYDEYKKINTVISSTNSLLDELKRNHRSLTNWMNTQQRVALIIYPVALAGGFMLGGVVESGKPVEAFMGKPIVLLVLLITIIILVPACDYLTRWMFRFSFGKHVDALQQNITELEEEK